MKVVLLRHPLLLVTCLQVLHHHSIMTTFIHHHNIMTTFITTMHMVVSEITSSIMISNIMISNLITISRGGRNIYHRLRLGCKATAGVMVEVVEVEEEMEEDFIQVAAGHLGEAMDHREEEVVMDHQEEEVMDLQEEGVILLLICNIMEEEGFMAEEASIEEAGEAGVTGGIIEINIIILDKQRYRFDTS